MSHVPEFFVDKMSGYLYEDDFPLVHTYIKPDIPLKDRAWNAATSVPNYFLSVFRKDKN